MNWETIFTSAQGSIEINKDLQEFVLVSAEGREVGGGDFSEIADAKARIVKQFIFMGASEGAANEAYEALISVLTPVASVVSNEPIEGTFFLRFTKDAERDLKNGRSLWFVYDEEEVARMKAEDKEMIFVKEAGDSGEWATFHNGLCGHGLNAETLEEAIEEAKTRSNNFGSIKTDSWAIFEGDYATGNDIMEGDIFTPERVAYFCKSTFTFDGAL
jgi:hypothetical protein